MKQRLITFLILFLSACAPLSKTPEIQPQNHPDLSYIFEPVFVGSSLQLKVDIFFRSSSSGKGRILLPSTWGSQKRLDTAVKGLKSLSPLTRLYNTQNPAIKQYTAPKNQLVHLQYTLTQPWKGSPHQDRRFYRPILNIDYLHMIGEAFLIHPDWDQNRPRHVTLRWNHLPKNWTLINSFGLNKTQQDLSLPLTDLKQALYTAGDFRIFKKAVRGHPFYLALRGEWPFADEQLLMQIQSSLTGVRDFWNDDDFPFFMVAVLPLNVPCCHQAGINLKNAVTLFLSREQPLTPTLNHLITHELFHTWNGRKIKRKEPETEVFWFAEGFTNYFTRLINLKAGLINLKDYLEGYNRVLFDYYTNPKRKMGHQKNSQAFWTDKNARNIPYLRGEILAHKWDNRLKVKNQKSTLKDYMRSLLRSGKEISNASIIDTMNNFSGENISLDVKKHIEIGKEIESLPVTIGPCIQITKVLFAHNTQVPQYKLDENKWRKNPDSCLKYLDIR